MRNWKPYLMGGVVGVLAACGFAGAAFAGSETDILLNKLVEKGLLTASDAQEVRNEMNPELASREKDLDEKLKTSGPEWARNWKFGGDLRLRNEYRNRTGSGQDVNRQRVRFRYGFNAKVNDHLRVGARLATGSTTDPVSTNQTFDTSFNHKTFLLDRAFVEYGPEVPGLNEFKVTGGIMENPFWTVGPLVWDDDLNFDGAAVHLAKTIGPVTAFTNDGIFLLQSGVTEAPSLWSAQAGLSFKPFAAAEAESLQHLKVTGAVGYYDYRNVTNPLSENSAISTAGGAKGNSAGIDDLNLMNPTLEISSQYADVPASFFGDLVTNEGGGKGKRGFQVGIKFGKATVPFDLLKGWEGGYYFERLEPDATFGAFTDSDFGNGGTNHRGHVWWVKVAVMKGSEIGFKYFNTQELKGSKNHADTFQADWVTKF